MSKYRFSIVACARWESRFIVEWLNYYRIIGFDHVFLYCNDDDPRELYGKVLPFILGSEPFVTFRHYPVQGEQLQMYSHFLQSDAGLTEWVGFFDIDEFLRLPPGTTIAAFVDGIGEPVDCVMFNWVFFGPNGHKDEPGDSILSDYTLRQGQVHPLTKYVARSEILTDLKADSSKQGVAFWHCPIGHTNGQLRAVNAIGEDMSTYYDGFPQASAAFANDQRRSAALLETAIIHHYAFRSEAAFLERARRGLGGAFGDQTIWSDLATSDGFASFLAGLHEVEDRSLAEFWPNQFESAKATTIAVTHHSDLPVSRGRVATQSSISTWSEGGSPEADAIRALNGVIDGRGKFHTDLEDTPWWRVDLGAVHGIREVRLFNRMELPGIAARANRLAIDIGFDPEHFIEVFRRESDEPFGGVDGHPLVFAPSIPIPGRFVRVRLMERNYLHLDQVEVYGEVLAQFG